MKPGIKKRSWSCIWTLWLPNFAMGSDRERGGIAKLPYFGMKCMKPRIWKSSRSCICTLFLLKSVAIELCGHQFPRYRPLSLYGQQFPKYRPFLKVAILDMRPRIWIMFHKCHMDRLSIKSRNSPKSRNWAHFVQCAAVSERGAGFQNYHIWSWKLDFETCSRSYITLSTPGDRNCAYFRSTWSGFWDTDYFQNSYIWASNLAYRPPFYPMGRNWAYFRSTRSGFRDRSVFKLKFEQSSISAYIYGPL